ncbi:MAG TPA: DUF2182 domain-containing protein [Vicinamibacterales bacterium]|nr:DUF2182 domain-containing protein [Vicinamibacterales bacterium]
MPGHAWPMAAASFLGMWVAMMVSMMLPSLIPMLRHYRQAVATIDARRLGLLTAIVGVGYFFVWTVFGVVAYPLGVALNAIELQHPAVAGAIPIAGGVVVLIAGAFQFTSWKARQLACCREPLERGCALPAAAAAWRHGFRLGLNCTSCCANLMVILLVLGVMDVRVMAVVTVAITAERLAPAGERVAHAIGAVIVGSGVFLLVRIPM